MFDITGILWGAVIGLVGFVHQRNEVRFSKIEDKVEKAVTKEDFRQILDDKIEPLKDDITEVKSYCQNIQTKLSRKTNVRQPSTKRR